MLDAPVVEVDFPEAIELAAYQAILRDLGFARQCMQRLLEIDTEGGDDPIESRSYWTSALMAYARCFASGRRPRLLAEDLEGLPGDPLVLHEHVIAQRNRLVAHSVNPFEQMKVGIVLAPREAGKREILGITALAITLVGWKPDDLKQFQRLIDLVVEHVVRERVEELYTVTLEKAGGITIDELYARPNLKFQAPPPEEA